MSALSAFLMGGNPLIPASEETPKKPAFSQTALGALNQMGLQSNYPEIRMVDRNHDMLGGRRHARAVRYESGPDALFLDKSIRSMDPTKAGEIIQHEASHIAAWNELGTGISEHGRQWLELCLARATHPRVCKTERFR